MLWLFENIIIAISIIIILMFLDYSLTVLGQKYYKKYYRKYVLIDKYELNPMFQQEVEKGKYPLKHLVGVFLISFIIIYLYFYDPTRISYEITTSMLFFVYLITNLNHITNIGVFKWVGKNPDLIKGKIMIIVTHRHVFLLPRVRNQLQPNNYRFYMKRQFNPKIN